MLPPEHPAEALYLRLRNVGLDKSRVYHIRDVTLERAAFHITFDDGTIAFTEDVAGHITGRFFRGRRRSPAGSPQIRLNGPP